MLSSSQAPIAVFCSYAHKDKALLNQLHIHLATLKSQKLITTWHDRQILPGSDWSRDIDDHLEQSALILLLISPDFLASRYCYEIEMQRALKRHEADEARVVPIILRPCDWQHTPIARLQCLPQDGKPITEQHNQDRAWTDITAGLRRVIEDLQLLPAIARQSDLPSIWNVPYSRNPFFLGRDAVLAQLHSQLQSGQPAALSQVQGISGLGGIGKTQLAVHYAYRYHQDYKAVLWARADTRESLTTSYSDLATLLNLPERDAQEQQITVQAVKTWLQTHRDWLLILDNADDLDLLPPFLPPVSSGHILITTRARAMQRLAHRIDVETLPPDLGALFLLRRATLLPPAAPLEQATPEEKKQALQLTRELGGLPLALDQAGAYLEATGTSLQQYQQIYQRHRQELLKEHRSLVVDHPEPVATTWSLSFQRVAERSAAAADLLRLCAFLSPDAIPEELLTEGAKELGEPLASAVNDPFLFNQAIEALRAYSLLDRDPRTQLLSVHRLVQAVLQDQMDEPGKIQWAERAVRTVSAAFPYVEHKVWSQCERILPHALIAADLIEQCHFVFPATTHLLNQTGAYLYARGLYREAGPLLKRALKIFEEQLGGEHPDTALSLNNLAALYDAQGKYGEAEPLYKRALKIREEQLGGEHPDTAQSLNNLAVLYKAQGKYGEAEPLYKRALSILEQRLGRGHPNTVMVRRNYAFLLRKLGRDEEADALEGDGPPLQ